MADRGLIGIMLMVALVPAAAAAGSVTGVPCTGTSTVVPDTYSAAAGDTVRVVATVLDCYGTALRNLLTYFYSTRDDEDVILGSPSVTDVNGQAEARVTTKFTGSSSVYVVVQGVTLGPSSPIQWNVPHDAPYFSVSSELWARTGQAGFSIPVLGRNTSDLKGFSVCLEFDPDVFTANAAEVDTVGTAAGGGYLVVSGHTDSTVQAGVVFSYDCPPSIPPADRPPALPFIDLLLDVRASAPTGPTVVAIRDIGLATNRMTDCQGNTIEPCLALVPIEVVTEGFIRGDDDGDGELTISDPISSLCAQFAHCALVCYDASDVDDDGEITISDPIFNLNAQFGGGPVPAAPFPQCGPDPTGDDLICACHPRCMGCSATEQEPGVDEAGWLASRALTDKARYLESASIAEEELVTTASAAAQVETAEPGTASAEDRKSAASLATVPNPARSTTSVCYGLAGPGKVEIVIYNTRGQLVRSLKSRWEAEGAGMVVWDGRDTYGHEVPDGVYFCRITALGTSQVRKIVIMR